MISRRDVLWGLLFGGLAAPLAVEAQQAPKVYRVGLLLAGSATSSSGAISPTAVAFQEGLRNLGWLEGQNIVFERRYAEDRYERFPALAAELVRLKVDVIVAGAGWPSLNAARNATKTIPIVMLGSSSDPVGDGLIQSLARPGGNITGIAFTPEEVPGKRFQLLKEVIPGLARVGILWDLALGPLRPRLSAATKEAARSLRVELVPFEVHEPTEIDGAVRAAAQDRVGGLIVVGSPMVVRHQREVADSLLQHRLPGMGRLGVLGRGRDAHVLWPEPAGPIPTRGQLRRQDPAGRESRRPSCRTAHQVRADHQPQDCQGPRPDDPAVAPAAGGSGDRVAWMVIWAVTCSCGWTREFSRRWSAESAAKLHPKLGDPTATHIVRIEPPPDEPRRAPELPLS